MAESDLIELSVTSEGDGPDVILLHGLFGMGSNLGGLGRSLRDAYRVHLVDLPDHGRSAWTQHSGLRRMADAVAQWLQSQSIAGAHCVGHSLGGKVAMQFALDHPAAAASVVVADIAPVTYSRSHDQVFAALNAVSAVEVRSRADADAILSGYLEDAGVRQFLLMSLYRDSDGSYRWRFNREGLQRNYAAYLQAPEFSEPYAGPALFIRGALSGYVGDEHLDDIHRAFHEASVETMADCGHWLHVEQPAVFNSLVRQFIDGGAV